MVEEAVRVDADPVMRGGPSLRELRRAGWAFTLSPMRDLDTIDSELQLHSHHCLVGGAIPRAHGGKPSSRQVDELLDERLAHPRGPIANRRSEHVAPRPAEPRFPSKECVIGTPSRRLPRSGDRMMARH